MKYSLPCSCGKTIPIEISQAGQTVACSCGKQVEVPAMRLVRQLEPIHEDSAARAKRSGNWSLLQRLLFSLGLAIATAGFSIAGFYQWSRSKLDIKEVAWDSRLDTDLKQFDNTNVEEAWDIWVLVRESGIGPYRPPHFIRNRKTSALWKRYVVFGLGLGIGGLALTVIAFLLPRQRPAAPRGRPPIA